MRRLFEHAVAQGLLHLLLHAVGLLCALAAAVFATAAQDRYGALTLAAGFLIGSAWLQPDPGWTGAIVAATAGLALVRPGGAPATRVAPLVAGLAGGLWSRVLGGYGLPLWLGCLLASGVVALAAVSSARDPRFVAMNLAAEDMVRPSVHPGVVLGVAAVVALGGLHTLRRRG